MKAAKMKEECQGLCPSPTVSY